ncbi:uncharacterized protein LOC5519932 isoform X2 [Nematostella vectensis]|uniref:uncharacterized protein LOC5519932 isoform X2 n=1 Tax=Nematostella vectensis TaxID=45351 RepID=UPI00207738FA|nr:uncharacterized protein LOC5519932 isoform X2 [Nematostella vectensis]
MHKLKGARFSITYNTGLCSFVICTEPWGRSVTLYPVHSHRVTVTLSSADFDVTMQMNYVNRSTDFSQFYRLAESNCTMPSLLSIYLMAILVFFNSVKYVKPPHFGNDAKMRITKNSYLLTRSEVARNDWKSFDTIRLTQTFRGTYIFETENPHVVFKPIRLFPKKDKTTPGENLLSEGERRLATDDTKQETTLATADQHMLIRCRVDMVDRCANTDFLLPYDVDVIKSDAIASRLEKAKNDTSQFFGSAIVEWPSVSTATSERFHSMPKIWRGQVSNIVHKLGKAWSILADFSQEPNGNAGKSIELVSNGTMAQNVTMNRINVQTIDANTFNGTTGQTSNGATVRSNTEQEPNYTNTRLTRNTFVNRHSRRRMRAKKHDGLETRILTPLLDKLYSHLQDGWSQVPDALTLVNYLVHNFKQGLQKRHRVPEGRPKVRLRDYAKRPGKTIASLLGLLFIVLAVCCARRFVSWRRQRMPPFVHRFILNQTRQEKTSRELLQDSCE